jgi:predicted nucleic acid-binding protein
MNEVFVLDACAVIALLEGEKGADVIVDVYDKAYKGVASIVISKINLLEVYYDFYRRSHLGKEYANKVLYQFRQHPTIRIVDISDAVFVEAGRLKANYKISLADSIAAAQTLVSCGTLLTADYEFKTLEEANEPINFLWIR